MAVKNFTKDTNVGSDSQPVATATGLAAADITNVIQVPLGISAMRVFAAGATTFTVDVKAAPTANVAGLVTIASLTQATPSIVVPGPIGAMLRLDCAAAAGGTVNVGIMGLKED